MATSRLITTGIVVGAIVAAVLLVEGAVGIRVDDRPTRFQLRRTTRYVAAIVLLVALAAVWRVFHGRIGLVVGLGAAGLGFALQEVLGSIFGWVNILSGHIFRIGTGSRWAASKAT